MESPTFFSCAVALILDTVLESHQQTPAWMFDCPLRRVAFMDDILTWSCKTSHLQQEVSTMQKVLRRYGLKVNLAKSQLLCWGDVGPRSVNIDGTVVHAIPEDQSLTFLGLPVGGFRV